MPLDGYESFPRKLVLGGASILLCKETPCWLVVGGAFGRVVEGGCVVGLGGEGRPPGAWVLDNGKVSGNIRVSRCEEREGGASYMDFL